MKITVVEPESIGAELGLRIGDELLEVNGRKVLDNIDFRFHEAGEDISLKISRRGDVIIYDIEKDEGERVGIDFEEMKILSCGNDCIFCFVDQNPKGMRSQVYFRDGDYRLSFMYGNYTTMTNAGPAILRRIAEQRLSPQYISVHVTDYEVRKRLMGLKKDDQILEKIAYLHDHGIAMHTQIVLCPGINDGDILERTVRDLFRFHRHIVSLAIVPVGLTDHRFGLAELKKVDREYARNLLATIGAWQKRFRRECGRAFVYPSDEFFIVADQEIPAAGYYDGFPQTENGVGMVRQFVGDCRKQRFPRRLRSLRTLTLVTGELAFGFMSAEVLPLLRSIENLNVRLVSLPNTLFGRNVTVAGLLSGRCITGGLKGSPRSDVVLLPPDIMNADGLLLDDLTLQDVERELGCPVFSYDGRWEHVFALLDGVPHNRRRLSSANQVTT